MPVSPVFASNNVRHLCRQEISGGGQIVIQGNYAFIGHQHGPEGTTILDISDPRNPRTVSVLMASHPWSHSHKVRVVGDLMVVNSEIEPGKGDRRDYPDGGFRIYDIKDKTEPKLLSVSRRRMRAACIASISTRSYAYISTEMDGFVGNILVIYDIRNPSKPVEVSRWWMPGQNAAAGEPPHPQGRDHSLHHAMRCGNEMYAGCWFSGISIIDVSDIAHPRTLGRHEYDPPHAEPTHTFLKVPFPDRRPEHRGLDRRGAPQARAGRRPPARAAAHLGRDRSDQAENPLHLPARRGRRSRITATTCASARTSFARSSIATACCM